MNTHTEVAIIGAGLCGLTVAAQLKGDGVQLVVIEKSRGVGGRVATRRDGEAVYDHGAAFYVETSEQPQLWHGRWSAHNKSKLWLTTEEGHRQHFCGVTGMTALAKDLAQEQNLILGEKVIRLEASPHEVQILCESQRVLSAKRVVLTSPLPQSLDILKSSGLTYPEELSLIQYEKALVGLFELKNLNLPFQFLKPEDSSIFTISNNQSKGISQSLALTVVMSSSWSEAHFNHDESEVLDLIEAELQRVLSSNLQIQKAQLKKWRYSQPASQFKELYAVFNKGQVWLAGDAFGGGSIAGAVRSAVATVEGFKKIISQNERPAYGNSN